MKEIEEILDKNRHVDEDFKLRVLENHSRGIPMLLDGDSSPIGKTTLTRALRRAGVEIYEIHEVDMLYLEENHISDYTLEDFIIDNELGGI